MASLAILLLLARFSSSIAVSSNSYISRSAEQQVIATVAPAVVPDVDGQSAQPFLTSPSGSFAAYLRRTVDGAGGLGGDACYVQVQQAGVGGSVWESDCTPVGGADACDLAFSPVGLELFAGGHSLWDTGVDADPWTLSLDDGGDIKIISKEGVTVWTASGEPWTGEQCGAPMPVSPEPSTDSVLPPPSTAGSKLVTPPSETLAGAGSTDFSSGDQPAPPPVDTLPDMPVQPPAVDTAPEQPLAPPPADASPDLPDLPLPPPPAYTSPDSPDQPLPPPPTADVSPDQPLYPSPPPAPATFGPDAPVAPPFGVPLATPSAGDDSSLPGTATPPGEPGSPGSVPFSGPSPAGMPHPRGPAHPHQLPLGASPPLPDALAPGAHGEGAGKQPGVPFGHGQQPQPGVFGQQPQLLNGEGQPLEESSGGWSGNERGGVVACIMALFAVTATALGFGF
ncbi:hypothetical protein PAHAL_2G345900 [Panicum hallii]|uniref:Bulb-type lectin domain-containing protein n=1 Tax=Panicum hallii TaxID=206008 RepID=A0A2T8KRI1_9POAL|nr:proline-rich receptor-like protein kinase PERK9 [Panicum hallii]PVH64732.1 hypothetical protein PAHAL_2G345900 [Panicum hallii]